MTKETREIIKKLQDAAQTSGFWIDIKVKRGESIELFFRGGDNDKWQTFIMSPNIREKWNRPHEYSTTYTNQEILDMVERVTGYKF